MGFMQGVGYGGGAPPAPAPAPVFTGLVMWSARDLVAGGNWLIHPYTNDAYTSLNPAVSGNPINAGWTAPRAGVLRRWRFRAMRPSLAAVELFPVTLYRNGVATALVLTGRTDPTATINDVDEVAVAQEDRFAVWTQVTAPWQINPCLVAEFWA